MDTSLLLYTVLFVGMFLAFPKELKRAGFNIDYIFHGWLGDPQLDFLGYHVRRTSLTFLIHCCLPFFFLAGVHSNLVSFTLPDYLEVSITTLGVLTASYGLICFFFHSSLQRHPVYKLLQKYDSQLSRVKIEVNSQARSVAAYHTDNGAFRLTVTTQWLLAPTSYAINVALLDDSHLELESSRTLELSEDAKEGSQYVKVIVTSTSGKYRRFVVILNSLDYKDFTNNLIIPVHNTRSIIINQSLSEQFTDTFLTHIRDNPKYTVRRIRDVDNEGELENCLGCVVKKAEVKLRKTCESSRQGGKPCTQCRCRPMWCSECMARWFCSKQDQSNPTTWLGGKAPCPMCRQVFCILDVCMIVSV